MSDSDNTSRETPKHISEFLANFANGDIGEDDCRFAEVAGLWGIGVLQAINNNHFDFATEIVRDRELEVEDLKAIVATLDVYQRAGLWSGDVAELKALVERKIAFQDMERPAFNGRGLDENRNEGLR